MIASFEKILTTWLETKRLSPEQAAPILGVGFVAIYAWLKGEYQPSNTRVPLLAKTLGIREDTLRSAIARSRRISAKA